MKRAYLRKVKPNVSSSGSVDNAIGQTEQGSRGVRRRARTSAAMVGLALSMGATGLVIPRQSDGAAAAESAGTEASVSPVSQAAPTGPSATEASNLDTAAVSSAAAEVQHKVAAGETLIGIAREYQVTVAAIAKANKLSTRAGLQVGQLLKIPVQSDVQLTPASSSPSVDSAASEKAAIDSLQLDREQALSRLRVQREQLQSKLLELRPEQNAEQSVGPSQEAPAKLQQAPIAELPPNLAPAAQSSSSQRQIEQESASVPSVPQAHSQTDSQPQVSQAAAPIAPQQNVPEWLPEPDWIRSSQNGVTPTSQVTAAPAIPENLLALRRTPVIPVTQPTIPQTVIPQLSSESGAIAYRVGPGDTVAEIAEAYNVPQSLLISANRISNPNFIFVGQVLQVPGNQAASPQVPTRESSFEAKAPSVAEAPLPTRLETPAAPVQISSVQGIEASQTAEAVTVPTIPTAVASEPSATTLMLPQQVAAAPISTTPATPAAGSELMLPATPAQQSNAADNVTNPFVQNLLAEIRTLRQQHQHPSGAPQVQAAQTVTAPAEPATIAAATVSGSMAVNPQFQRRNESAVGGSAPAPETNQSQVVAVAPLGSENYEPLLRPVTGRMVSPDLPPLPGADNFLPNQREVFDGFIWPARGLLTSGYGWRWGRMHRGIDIAADVGTPIYAAADGVIEFAGWNAGGYGNMIEIRHADGSMTRYAHLNRISVRSGQRIGQSQQIGEMGSTGYSTGPHLHFEVHLAQGTVNPVSYLPSR